MQKQYLCKLSLVLTILSVLSLTSCNNKKSADKEALNIIFMVGDGMGLSQVSTAFYFKNEPTNFLKFKHIGLSITHSAKQKITDSAAGATAFSTGKKTYNGAIGVDTDTLPLKNIVEILSERDYLTGLVVTSPITHATPAAFYAHTKFRSLGEDIAKQLVYSPIDFFAGSNVHLFNDRKDNINYIDSLTEKGFYIDTVLNSNVDFARLKKKYGYLADSILLYSRFENKRGYYLPNMTKNALDYLSKGDDGFFLMVEGSQIDWACHDNDSAYLFQEVFDFDKAIGVALDFASKNENTLVIVTADHETGGFALTPDTTSTKNILYKKIKPTFATTKHSAALVPVFAYGKEAKNFSGVYQNTEIFHKIMDLLND